MSPTLSKALEIALGYWWQGLLWCGVMSLEEFYRSPRKWVKENKQKLLDGFRGFLLAFIALAFFCIMKASDSLILEKKNENSDLLNENLTLKNDLEKAKKTARKNESVPKSDIYNVTVGSNNGITTGKIESLTFNAGRPPVTFTEAQKKDLAQGYNLCAQKGVVIKMPYTGDRELAEAIIDFYKARGINAGYSGNSMTGGKQGLFYFDPASCEFLLGPK